MKKLFSVLVLAMAGLLGGGSAQAQLVNGGFEAGLQGWTLLGQATLLDESPAGGQQLGLSSGDGAAEISALASATGLSVESFDTAQGYAYQGSLAQQSFHAAAGQRVSFSWQFQTQEPGGDPAFADYAFMVLDGQLIRLGGVGSAPTEPSVFSFLLGAGSQHTLSFGVVDLGDYGTASDLRVDALTISAVPEPGTWALMLAGLGVLGWHARRRPR